MKLRMILCLFVALSFSTSAQTAADIDIRQPARSYGQLVHVSAYSFVYSYEKGRQFNLAVTLSIRNTDLERSITVESVEYRDINGAKIKEYLTESATVAPGACIQFLINESDPAGGAGPSFRVRWRSQQAVFQPVVETVMIGTKSQQGISFMCPGRVLQELLPETSTQQN